jgi:hypothetical protein
MRTTPGVPSGRVGDGPVNSTAIGTGRPGVRCAVVAKQERRRGARTGASRKPGGKGDEQDEPRAPPVEWRQVRRRVLPRIRRPRPAPVEPVDAARPVSGSGGSPWRAFEAHELRVLGFAVYYGD